MVIGRFTTSDYGVAIFVEKTDAHFVDDYGNEVSDKLFLLVTNDYGVSVSVLYKGFPDSGV
ncbi:MAG: hypothetical protein NTZ13_02250 [Candidatus Parcubacteria bacterium]|nr:hypothetical protein [Candidatus Parcubacteria bacterium]